MDIMKFQFHLSFLVPLLTILWACSPSGQPVLTPTSSPTSTVTPTNTSTPSSLPPTKTPSATPQICLTQPGRIETSVVEETKPPQEFIIYLPPCYYQIPDERYPVLYLLHGQTFTDDQWVRLGAVETADRLILSGEAPSFIIVFPDDRYWNVQSGTGFGGRVIDHLIPYIDRNYRTNPERAYRAIGGMSRGAGWALRLGLTRWDLFSSLGLHSLAAFLDDRPALKRWLGVIPPESLPRIYMDSGENDRELGDNLEFLDILSDLGIPYEWHLNAGEHDERYWSAHVEDYLRWYVAEWASEPIEQ
jgi:enterochelin esterase-like enzyme